LLINNISGNLAEAKKLSDLKSLSLPSFSVFTLLVLMSASILSRLPSAFVEILALKSLKFPSTVEITRWVTPNFTAE
jgi:hypothetical protein